MRRPIPTGGIAIGKLRTISAALAAATLATVLASPARAATPIPIYLFAGQSNMVGYASNTHELATVAPALVQPQKNVQFFGPYDDYAVRWAPLSPPTEVRGAMYHSGFGPEVSAAAVLSSLHHGANFAVVKYAVSGTSLYRRWNPASGDLYRNFIARVRASAATLKAPYRIAGLFWMQGESDADSSSHAQAYGANLTNFIASVRRDLRAPSLPVVIGQIRDIRLLSRLYPYSSIVRQQQYNVALADAKAFLVPSDGLELSKVTPVHFSTRGTVDLGRRMVQRAFGL